MKISFSFLLYFNFFAFSLLARLDFENLKRQGESGGKRGKAARVEQNQRENQSEKGGLVEVEIPPLFFYFFFLYFLACLDSKI